MPARRADLQILIFEKKKKKTKTSNAFVSPPSSFFEPLRQFHSIRSARGHPFFLALSILPSVPLFCIVYCLSLSHYSRVTFAFLLHTQD